MQESKMEGGHLKIQNLLQLCCLLNLYAICVCTLLYAEICNMLSNKLKDQCQKNIMLEDTIKKIRTDMDLMTSKMADIGYKNDETRKELIKVQY